jgi:hypothetical protein
MFVSISRRCDFFPGCRMRGQAVDTALHAAARSRNVAALINSLSAPGANTRAPDATGSLALHHACSAVEPLSVGVVQDARCAQLLLTAGPADVNGTVHPLVFRRFLCIMLVLVGLVTPTQPHTPPPPPHPRMPSNTQLIKQPWMHPETHPSSAPAGTTFEPLRRSY